MFNHHPPLTEFLRHGAAGSSGEAGRLALYSKDRALKLRAQPLGHALGGFAVGLLQNERVHGQRQETTGTAADH